MKYRVALLLACASCGSPPRYAELFVVPDAIGLIGVDHARAFSVVGRASAGGAFEVVDDFVAASAAGVSIVDQRVRGVAPGHFEISIDAGGARVVLPVAVGDASSPFAGEIVEVTRGEGDGYGRDRLPEVIQGAPKGGGLYQGTTDALSLGIGGSITVSFPGIAIYDGPGADLVVFENAFRVAGSPEIFAEPARVAVDAHEFACAPDAAPYTGCAGVAPVLAGPAEPELDPTDPDRSGGDLFDLASIGVERASLVTITDAATGTVTGTNSGFDLDAIAIVNAMPEDAASLAPSIERLALRIGERAPIPRFDLVRSDGSRVEGVAVELESELLDPPFILARQIGRAVLTARAGPFSAQIDLEVEP